MSLNRASSENQTVTKKITSSLERELTDLQNLSEECSIYRVPQRLRQVNIEAYTPTVVAIGPIHHGKDELKAMEEHKRRYLKHFLHLGKTVGLDHYVDFVRERETDLRNCYAETIHIDTEEFIKMILIDSAFLILILVRGTLKLDMTDYRIFNKPKMLFEVRNDILLLENQLPFFILQELFGLSKIAEYLKDNCDLSGLPDLREGIDLIKLTYRFFNNWIVVPGMINKFYDIPVEHLLHFLRICYIPQRWDRQTNEPKTLSLPGAMELYQAGVKFEPVNNKELHQWNLFDINFGDGILKIPQLELFDSKVICFHNLCAYEQCHSSHIVSMNPGCHPLGNLISDYISIMFYLVKSPKDAELLIQEGIIVNGAFSNEGVASFFNKLGVGVIFKKSIFCYGNVIEDLNEYRGKSWPKLKVTLKQDYFKNRWAGISVFAAGFLFVLTIIQTVCSLIQVIHPSSK